MTIMYEWREDVESAEVYARPAALRCRRRRARHGGHRRSRRWSARKHCVGVSSPKLPDLPDLLGWAAWLKLGVVIVLIMLGVIGVLARNGRSDVHGRDDDQTTGTER